MGQAIRRRTSARAHLAHGRRRVAYPELCGVGNGSIQLNTGLTGRASSERRVMEYVRGWGGGRGIGAALQPGSRTLGLIISSREPN